MLTATDLTGEETHEKKNPRFLMLILALFIMAGVGYAAFWWVNKQENIITVVEETPSVNTNAQAWYEEQKKLMDAKLNIQPNNEIAVTPIDSLAVDSATNTSDIIETAAVTPSPAVKPAPTIVIPPVVTPAPRTIVKPETKYAETNRIVAKPKPVAEARGLVEKTKPSNTEIFYEDQVYKPVRTKKTIADNIKPSRAPQYFQEDNQQPKYNGSVPPTNNKRPIEPIYIPVQRTQKEIEKNAPAFYSPMITRDELNEFMRQFPYKKTTIHFVCYSKPNEEMEAIKAQIFQFLLQNGYTDMETHWSIWSDHTPVKEVHYGKSGLTGANFYIPSFK